ncbi:MAG: hypothetical protein LWY06_14485 [Firmicutes bacterium]|nr:hypothetical protein [Bacillota bacterium]
MVLLFILGAGICFAEDGQGYHNRFVFQSGYISVKPVADSSGLYVAVDNDGVYKFSPGGEKELYFHLREKFVSLTRIKTNNYAEPYDALLVITRSGNGVENRICLSARDFSRLDLSEVKGVVIRDEKAKVPGVDYKVPMGYTADDFSYLTSAYVSAGDCWLTVIKAVNTKNGITEVLLIDKDGKVQYSIPLSGRYGKDSTVVSGKSIFIVRELREGIKILDRINTENGTVTDEMLIGETGPAFLTASLSNDYLYFVNNKGGENSLLTSVIVFKTDLTGSKSFIGIPIDKINYTYSQLLFASNLNPYFKKYMATKYGKTPEPYDRAMIDDAAAEYKKAWAADPFNPFFGMYYILAETELGKKPAELKSDFDKLESQCGYNVYSLSLVGGLFCRYRLDGQGADFLQKAVDYSPASETDFARSFTTGNNSPDAYLMGILGRMSEDRDPSMERIVTLVSYMSSMMPSSEFNYYLWSGISNYYGSKGNRQQSKQAAEKARFYYKNNSYLSPGRVAGFDVISNLAVVLGILFVVLSFWFSFRANRKKRHYLSEVSGVSEMGGVLELLNHALKPAEKTLLGVLFSIGLISVLVDTILLFLMQKSGSFYGTILAVSLVVGIFAAVYMFAVLLRVERKHYGFATVTGSRSFRDFLNNSFLPFMSYREKVVLIIISILGPLFAIVLLGMLGSSVFTERVPASIAGGAYGTDSSRVFLENRLRQDPGNPYLQLILGYDCLLRKEYDEAEKHYLSFLSFNPADRGAAVNLAISRSYGNPEEARQMMEKIVQNRKISQNWRFADRLYYNLILLDKNILGKDSVSPYQAELDKTGSKTVAANSLINPGKLLPIPPEWDQERGAYTSDTDLSRMVYSYLFPFVMLNDLYNGPQGTFGYGRVFVNFAAAMGWLWTLLLIISFFAVKDPPFMPSVCKRCGKIICEKCTKQDDRGWCLRCAENTGFVSPSPLCFFVPGTRQILLGETVKGILYMILFFYGVSYCLLMIFPYRNMFPGGAQGRYLGILQSIMAPNTIFPYNVITDPVLWVFAVFVILLCVGIFALNAWEVLKGGRYRDKGVRTDVETQLIEYKAMRTRLIGQSRLL